MVRYDAYWYAASDVIHGRKIADREGKKREGGGSCRVNSKAALDFDRPLMPPSSFVGKESGTDWEML